MELFNRHITSISHVHTNMLLDVVTPQMLLISHFFQSLYYCLAPRNVTYTPCAGQNKNEIGKRGAMQINTAGERAVTISNISTRNRLVRARVYGCVCVLMIYVYFQDSVMTLNRGQAQNSIRAQTHSRTLVRNTHERIRKRRAKQKRIK